MFCHPELISGSNKKLAADPPAGGQHDKFQKS